MKISEEYRQQNGLTPDKIADTMIAFYEKIDARSAQIIEMLESKGIKLNCKAGCCGCCRDNLTMTQSEASVIRKLFPEIGKETPHAEGMCPFLDASGLCRIYAARPYICRTHGLPIRAFISAQEAEEFGIPTGDEPQDSYEIRDICEENEPLMDVMELDEDACWTEGVAQAQIAAMDLCTFGESERVSMRSFFEN